MTNLITESVHISKIQIGDTIMCDGVLTTVTKHNFKDDIFLGPRFNGDASKKFLIKIKFLVPTNKGLILR